jgi:hypothetical protein
MRPADPHRPPQWKRYHQAMTAPVEKVLTLLMLSSYFHAAISCRWAIIPIPRIGNAFTFQIPSSKFTTIGDTVSHGQIETRHQEN